MTGPGAWQATPAGLRLRLRVSPKARRAGIEGIADLPDGPALKIAVTAPPADGQANAAVIALLAKALGVPKSAIAVTAGATARLKTVEVTGDGARLAAMLDALARDGTPTSRG